MYLKHSTNMKTFNSKMPLRFVLAIFFCTGIVTAEAKVLADEQIKEQSAGGDSFEVKKEPTD